MLSPFKQARLNELDAMLRAGGVDVKAVAERWGVQPNRIREYFQTLKRDGLTIVSEMEGDSKAKRRIYRYAVSALD